MKYIHCRSLALTMTSFFAITKLDWYEKWLRSRGTFPFFHLACYMYALSSAGNREELVIYLVGLSN